MPTSLPDAWNISIHRCTGAFPALPALRPSIQSPKSKFFVLPLSRRMGTLLRADDESKRAPADDPTIKLGQLAEALVRLARFVVCIRLHCEDMSVEQGMRFFRDEAFLEEPTARREAERGTFDPTYLVYSVGKLMMLKLRRDYKEQQAENYRCARSMIPCWRGMPPF